MMRTSDFPAVVNWRSPFTPLESIQNQDLEASGEDDGESPPQIKGGFMKGGRFAWQSIGPLLRVISTDDGIVRTSYTFGVSIHDDSAQINCVIEFPERRSFVEEDSDPHFPPLLIAGVGSELTGGYVHIYHAGTSKILRSIHFKEKVTALSMIICNPSENSPLRSLLKKMSGVLAVGTAGGRVYIIDLRRSDVLKAVSAPLKEVRNEMQCCSVQVINPEDDSPEFIKEQVKLCKRNGNHLGFVLNAKREKELDFHSSTYDDLIYVSKMLYIPETSTLVIGFNFSGFQLWDIVELQLLYSSKSLRNKMPVVGLGFLDPTDDPTAVCYLWVLYDSVNSESEDVLPFGCIFNCTYGTKECVPLYGNYFGNFLSIKRSFELDLPESLGTKGRLISCQTINKTTILPRISFLPQSDSSDDEGLSLDLFMMVFELWSDNGDNKTTQLVLFDLNQWYKAQFPVCGRPDKADSYMSIDEIKHDADNGLIAVCIDNPSVELFAQLINVEQYYFPSALSFDYIQMSDRECVSFHRPGAQHYALKKLEIDGAESLLRPAHLYYLCTSVSLKPFLYETIPDYELTSIEQRNFVLSLALEYGLIKCITDCIQQWADGHHCVSGCTLPAIIHWAWDRVSSIKQHADRLCVPLFDYSGTKLDTNGLRSLEHCRAQMVKALQVFKYIQAQHSNELIATSLEHRISALERVCEYYYAVLWFLNTGLLPEHTTMMLTNPHSETKEVVVLCNIMGTLHKKCSLRRVELKRLLVKVKEEYEPCLTSVSSLYLIDCFINEDKGGNSLISQWERESNGSSLGFYPPVALQYLLRIFLIHGVEYTTKTGIIFYFLLDTSDLIQKENPSSQPVIDRLMNFCYGFGLDKTSQYIIQSMWRIDNQQFERGIELLLKHENCKSSVKLWLHRAILRVLLFHSETKLALKYLQVMKPPLAESEDILFHLHTLLTNGLLSQAFLFQRKYVSQQSDLLLRLFDGCEKLGQLNNVLNLPLTPKEEEAFIQYLEKSKLKQASDLRVFYLLSRGRYTEAVNVNTHLQGLKNNVSSLTSVSNSNKPTPCTRDTIIGVISKTLPSITRELSAFCSAQRNTINSVKQVDRPTPLSMMVHTDSSSKSLPALPYYKTSNEALIQGAVSKTKEMWSSLLKTPAASKVQHFRSTVEDTPFLRAPKTSHQQADPLALFNFCATPARKPAETKRQAESPVESETSHKSKRSRVDVKAATLKYIDEKPWNLTTDLSDDALVFLRTPVVQRKVTPVNSAQADRSTPLSILKGSSNHTPKRSVQKSVSYKVSRKLKESGEGTPQIKGETVSAARQIRFSLPNEIDEEMKSPEQMDIIVSEEEEKKTDAEETKVEEKKVMESEVKEMEVSEPYEPKLKEPVTPAAMVVSQSGDMDVTPALTRFRQARQSLQVTPRKPIKAYLSSGDSDKILDSVNSKDLDGSSGLSEPSSNKDKASVVEKQIDTSHVEPVNQLTLRSGLSVSFTSTPTRHSAKKTNHLPSPDTKHSSRGKNRVNTRISIVPEPSDVNLEEELSTLPEASSSVNQHGESLNKTEIGTVEKRDVSVAELELKEVEHRISSLQEELENRISCENQAEVQPAHRLIEGELSDMISSENQSVSPSNLSKTQENMTPQKISNQQESTVSIISEEPMDVDEPSEKKSFIMPEIVVAESISAEMFSAGTTTSEVTSSENIKSTSLKYSSSDDILSENVPSENILSERTHLENSPSESIRIEDVLSKHTSSENIPSSNVQTENNIQNNTISVSIDESETSKNVSHQNECEEQEDDDDDDIVCLDSSSDNGDATKKDAPSDSIYDDEEDFSEASYSSDSEQEGIEELKNSYPEAKFGTPLASLQPLDTTYSAQDQDENEEEYNDEEHEEYHSEEEPEGEYQDEEEHEEEYQDEEHEAYNDEEEIEEIDEDSEPDKEEVDPFQSSSSSPSYDEVKDDHDSTSTYDRQDVVDDEREDTQGSFDVSSQVSSVVSNCDEPQSNISVKFNFGQAKTSDTKESQLCKDSTITKEFHPESELKAKTEHDERDEARIEVSETSPTKSSISILDDSTPGRKSKKAGSPLVNSVPSDSRRSSELPKDSSLQLTGNESALGSSKDPVPVGGYLSSLEGSGAQTTVLENQPLLKGSSENEVDKASNFKAFESPAKMNIRSNVTSNVINDAQNDETMLDDTVSENEVTVGTSFAVSWSESDNESAVQNRTWMFEKRVNDSVEQADVTQNDTNLADVTQASVTKTDVTAADAAQANVTLANVTAADAVQANVTQTDDSQAEYVMPSFIFGNLKDVAFNYQGRESESTPQADKVSNNVKKDVNKERVENESTKVPEKEPEITTVLELSENSVMLEKDAETPVFETPKPAERTRVLRSTKKDESLSDSELVLDTMKRKNSISSENDNFEEAKRLGKRRHYRSDSSLSPCMPDKLLLQAVMKSKLLKSPGWSVATNFSTSKLGQPEVSFGEDSNSAQGSIAKISDSSSSSQSSRRNTRRASQLFSKLSSSVTGESSKSDATRERRRSVGERRKSKLTAAFTSLDQISEVPETDSSDHLGESGTVTTRRTSKRTMPEVTSLPTRRSSFLQTRYSRNSDAPVEEEIPVDTDVPPKKRRSILNLSKLKKPRESASFKSRSRCSNYKFQELDVLGSDESFQEDAFVDKTESNDANISVASIPENAAEPKPVELNESVNIEDKLNDSIASRVSQRRTRRQSIESFASSQDVDMANLDDSAVSHSSPVNSVSARSPSVESQAESATTDAASTSTRSSRYRRVSLRKRSTPLYTTKELQKNSIRRKYSELDVIESEEELSDRTVDLNDTAKNDNELLITTRRTRSRNSNQSVTSENRNSLSEASVKTDELPVKKSTTPAKQRAQKSGRSAKNTKNVNDELKKSAESEHPANRSSTQTKTPNNEEQEGYTTKRRLTRNQNAILKKMEETSSPVVNSPVTRSRRSVDLNATSTPLKPTRRTRNSSESNSIASEVSRSSSRR